MSSFHQPLIKCVKPTVADTNLFIFATSLNLILPGSLFYTLLYVVMFMDLKDEGMSCNLSMLAFTIS